MKAFILLCLVVFAVTSEAIPAPSEWSERMIVNAERLKELADEVPKFEVPAARLHTTDDDPDFAGVDFIRYEASIVPKDHQIILDKLISGSNTITTTVNGNVNISIFYPGCPKSYSGE